MDSPPLSPLPQFTPTKSTSPLRTRRNIGRRSSSFSSTSSVLGNRRLSYTKRRLSTGSQFSNGYDELSSPNDARNRAVSGGGTLADELDFGSDGEWDQEEEETGSFLGADAHNLASSVLGSPSQAEGARDSGIDVDALHKNHTPHTSVEQQVDDVPFSLELEDAMAAIAQLAQTSTPDTTTRTLSALRDLTPQNDLETLAHRLATSTNSLTAHLATHIRTFPSAALSLLSPLAPPLPEADLSELSNLHSSLQLSLPKPDPAPQQGLAKLARDTAELQTLLSAIIDSLQLARQVNAEAARATKVTAQMVREARRERERVEIARAYIDDGGWDGRLAARWCAGECRDVLGGFEDVCGGLRTGIESGCS